MDELRLILLGAGLALIAGIWGFETWRRRTRARHDDELLDEATLEEARAQDAFERLRDVRVVENVRRITDLSEFDIDDPDGEVRVVEAPAPEAPAPEAPGGAAPVELREPASGTAADAPLNLAGLEGLRAEREGGPPPAAPERSRPTSSRSSSSPSPKSSARKTKRDARNRDRPSPVAPELAVVVGVMARGNERLDGGALRRALEAQGLRHGAMGIFHLAGPSPDDAPQFSVANAVEPGAFDVDSMDALRTPGVAFFLRLPGPADGPAAFERMLAAAGAVAESLGARLCDETRSTLTTQSINLLRERIAEHARRQMLES